MASPQGDQTQPPCAQDTCERLLCGFRADADACWPKIQATRKLKNNNLREYGLWVVLAHRRAITLFADMDHALCKHITFIHSHLLFPALAITSQPYTAIYSSQHLQSHHSHTQPSTLPSTCNHITAIHSHLLFPALAITSQPYTAIYSSQHLQTHHSHTQPSTLPSTCKHITAIHSHLLFPAPAITSQPHAALYSSQ
jgi:hypothetical protein